MEGKLPVSESQVINEQWKCNIFFSVLVCHFLEQGLNIMFLVPFFSTNGVFFT